jgi:hypothetical protein
MDMHSSYRGVIFRQYPVSTILALDSTRISLTPLYSPLNSRGDEGGLDGKEVMKFPLEE